MRKLTEEELNLIKDESCLRENINRLEKISSAKITEADKELLEALLDYRQKHCVYPGLAYYDIFEIAQLFN